MTATVTQTPIVSTIMDFPGAHIGLIFSQMAMFLHAHIYLLA